MQSISQLRVTGTVVAVLTHLLGCSHGTTPDATTESTGTLSIPLITSSGEHRYRLQGSIYVTGSTYRDISLNSDESTLTTSLPTGNYVAYLNFWALTRDDGTGNFLPVGAELSSNYGQSFAIFNQTSTALTFRFQTNGDFVNIGSGQLSLQVAVTEIDAVCELLGNGCAIDSWCAPTELTGQARACIASGTVAANSTCSSPLDCVANSSCYDFGSGAVCTPLCSIDEVGLVCASGGICIAQGSSYGVCAPESMTSSDVS